jgi:DeoR/GlpR family transcriptional regulator of sugar metabolism
MMLEMMGSSRRVVVLADSSKFGRSTFAQVAELSAADVLVTDAPVPERIAEALATAQVTVMVAGETSADVA